MLFPEATRVIYKDNPLHQVICQLRFPPILRIDTENPAIFQDRVRQTFPEFRVLYDEGNEPLPQSLSQSLSPEMRDLLSPKSNPRFQFFMRGESWAVTLAKDFVALETSKYWRWEEFRSYLESVMDALIQVYRPPYFSRVGLRYRNVIDRRLLGLEHTEWRDLIKEFVLGHLSMNETSDFVLEQQSKSLLRLNESGDLLRMIYGQVTDKDGDPNNILYLLDHDFYTNMDMEEKDVISRLTAYNSLNGRLFHWCIKESLHNAMGPESA